MFSSKSKSKGKTKAPSASAPQASTSTSNSSRSKRSRDELESVSLPSTIIPSLTTTREEVEEEEGQPKKKKGKKGKKVEPTGEEEEKVEQNQVIASTSAEPLPITNSIEIIDLSTPTKKEKKEAKRSAKTAKKALELEQQEGDSKAVAEEEDVSMEIVEPIVLEKSEEVSALEGLSAAGRKAKKGKGKAVEIEAIELVIETPSKKSKKRKEVVEVTPVVEGDTSRLEKELDLKNSVIKSQSLLLDSLKSGFNSLRSTVSCTICLETLEIPYSLRCGHVFCRKCLVNWFHREIAVDPINNHHDSDSSSSDEESFSGSDIILSDSNPNRRSNSSVGENMGDMSDTEDSDSSSSDSDSDMESGGVLRATMGGRTFNVDARGMTEDQAWESMQNNMFAAAASTMRPRPGISTTSNGTAVTTNGNRSTASTIESADEPGISAMRNARLARFGVQTGASVTFSIPQVTTASSTSARPANITMSTSRPTPTAARIIEIPSSPSQSPPPVPPQASTSIHRHHLDPVPPYEQRANQPNLLGEFGIAQKANLVCPQCRDIVDQTPSRIFVLTEMINMLKKLEKDGLFDDSEGGVSPKKEDEKEKGKEKEILGLDENDTTWGGLFKAAGEKETQKERRAREARVVRDVDDRVRRCGNCNWEIDELTGECEQCGRIWDLSDDSEGPLSDGEPTFGNLRERNHSLGDEERSEDEDERDEDDDAFLDDEETSRIVDYESDSEESAARTSPPRKRKGRLVIADSEEDEESSSSSSDDDVIVAGPSRMNGNTKQSSPKITEKKKNHLSQSKSIKKATKSVLVISDDEEAGDINGNDSSVMIQNIKDVVNSSEDEAEIEEITSSHFAASKAGNSNQGKKKKAEESSSEDSSSEEEKPKKNLAPKFKKRIISIDDDE